MAAGLPLVHLPQSLFKAARQTAEALELPLPRVLNGATLCEFLRAQKRPEPPLLPDEFCRPNVVRQMLGFVVGARPRGDALDLGPLQAVPLLLLHSGELRTFDRSDDCAICLDAISVETSRQLLCGHAFHDECIATALRGDRVARRQPRCPCCRERVTEGQLHARPTCFGAACLWDWHELLPLQANLFMDKESQAIMLKADDSRDKVERAVATLGVRPFKPADLLPHREAVMQHLISLEPVAAVEWRRRFWSLLWQQRDRDDNVFYDWWGVFAEWEVVSVWPPHGQQGTCALRALSGVFSLHATDASQQELVVRLVHQLGFSVLGSEHAADSNQMGLLEPHVLSGDGGLCTLFRSSEAVWDQLRGQDRIAALSYFASRSQLNDHVLGVLRSLPLFLRADAGDADLRYTRLSGQVAYVCLRCDDGLGVDPCGNLVRLRLPGVCVLALPEDACKSVYNRLGVEFLTASQFVAQRVCRELPAAAARNELTPLLREIESWLLTGRFAGGIPDGPWRATIREAANEQRFASARSGTGFRLPRQLIDPRLEITGAFAENLTGSLPANELIEYLPLLIALGLQRKLPVDCIAACAFALDAEAQGCIEAPSVQQRRKSFLLVDMVCVELKDVWIKLREQLAAPRLQALQARERQLVEVTSLRIAVVATRPDAQQFVAWLAQNRQFFPASPSPRSVLRMGPLRGLLLTQECAELAWGRRALWAVNAGRPPASSLLFANPFDAMVNMTNECKDEVLDRLGCHADVSKMPLELLLEQLQLVATILEEKQIDRTDYDSRLYLSFERMYRALSIRLSGAEAAVRSERAAELLRELSLLPCAPLRITHDASGMLAAGGIVDMLPPTRCFFRLPDDAGRDQQYLHEASGSLVTSQAAAEALGVRAAPELADWVTSLRRVSELCEAAHDVLLPGACSAARFALRMVLSELRRAGSSGGELLQLYLLTEPEAEAPQQLLPAEKLVWLDRPALKHRCSRLHSALGLAFVERPSWLSSSDFELLCKHSGLRRLSSVVHEQLMQELAVSAPGEQDQQLEALLLSEEFASALALCGGGSETACVDEAARASAVLAALQPRWVDAPLGTELRAGEDRIEGSEKDDGWAYSDDDGELWLRRGALGNSRDERKLLDELSESALPRLLRAAGAPTPDVSKIAWMLSCWDTGPESISNVLEKKGVDVSLLRRRGASSTAPGRPVPVTMLDCVQQQLNCTFVEGECTAVKDNATADDLPQYHFAVVLPLAGGDSGGAGSGAGSSAVESSSLSRFYSLDEGTGSPVRRRHLEIFKLSYNEKHPPSHADGGGGESSASRDMVVADGAADGAAEGAAADGDISLAQLVPLLQQMENLEEDAYKAALQRLFLQWHPDISRSPDAARGFSLLRQHAAAYQGERQFAALYAAVGATAADGEEQTAAAAAYDAGAGQYSWFDEFERERQQVPVAVAAARRQHSVGSGAWRPHQEPRRLDIQRADLLWVQSVSQQRSAEVLAAGGQYSDSVWHSQQSAEVPQPL